MSKFKANQKHFQTKRHNASRMVTKFVSGSLLSGLLVMTAFSPVYAQSQASNSATAPASTLAEQGFNEMARALRELNFEATLVRSSGTRLEPMTWLHGTYSDGLEAELIVMLNGPDTRIVRLGEDTSYYFQPTDDSYTLRSDVTYGLLPAAFYQNFAALQPHYQVRAAGRGVRVTGRETHYLRILSSDNDRYHYGLWIDSESGMLLKMQMMTPQGEVLEQLQLTTFQERESMPISLSDLRGIPRPPRLHELRQRQPLQFSIQPQWLPSGFKLLRQTHRNLAATRLPTDYFLFSDGLTEVSVYVTEREAQSLPELGLQGPESIYNTSLQNHAITVVGKLPVATLQRIAENMAAAAPEQ
ncbi:negative regulator of sigma E activity [Pseudidiomarina sediminum]|uniref:Negative regulator of sigma E activity n=2 Tax=Pseudidiomarina sediminum TaxID=431675 RepID=A0A432Z824_9GAMM|nr:negative regulator of sigma E activity [Pseudidiomarina sediminum]